MAQLVKISIAVENKKLHSRACRALSSNQFICHYNEGGKCSPSRKCKLVDISFQQIDWSLDQGDGRKRWQFQQAASELQWYEYNSSARFQRFDNLQ